MVYKDVNHEVDIFCDMVNQQHAMHSEIFSFEHLTKGIHGLIVLRTILFFFKSPAQITQWQIVVPRMENILLTFGKGLREQNFYENKFLYNGPGPLSEKLFLDRKLTILEVESFQCIVQLESLGFEKYFNKHHIDFSSVLVKIPIYLESTLGFPAKDDENKKQLKMMKRQIPHRSNYKTKLTISHWKFIGDEVPGCLHGGLAIFNVLQENRYELRKLICHDHHTTGQNLQPVYSEGSFVCIIVYSYDQYSTLHLSLNFSSSACNHISIDACRHSSVDIKPPGTSSCSFPFLDMKRSLCLNVNDSICTIVQVMTDVSLAYLFPVCQVSFDFNVNILKQRKFQYSVRGYLPNVPFAESSMNQFFRVGGVNFDHDKTRDAKIAEEKLGNWRELLPEERSDYFDRSDTMSVHHDKRDSSAFCDCSFLQFGQEPVIINPFDEHPLLPFLHIGTFYAKSKNFTLQFLSAMPRTQKSLVFRFAGFVKYSFVDIKFTPIYDKITKFSSLFYHHYHVLVSQQESQVKSFDGVVQFSVKEQDALLRSTRLEATMVTKVRTSFPHINSEFTKAGSNVTARKFFIHRSNEWHSCTNQMLIA